MSIESLKAERDALNEKIKLATGAGKSISDALATLKSHLEFATNEQIKELRKIASVKKKTKGIPKHIFDGKTWGGRGKMPAFVIEWIKNNPKKTYPINQAWQEKQKPAVKKTTVKKEAVKKVLTKVSDKPRNRGKKFLYV